MTSEEKSLQGAIRIQAGERFHLRAPIHERFGGAKYAGISPSKKGFVLAFTSPVGNDHGYVDGWAEDRSLFFYAGQGQTGDQTLDRKQSNGRNNDALLRHQESGRRLVVFQGLPDRVYECMGEFRCEGHTMVDGVGTDGEPRKVIRFELRPIPASGDPEADQPTSDRETLEKRASALLKNGLSEEPPKGNPSPKRGKKSEGVGGFIRDPKVVAWVLREAEGMCEHCGDPAPFTSASTGMPYLEAHHVVTLGEGGADTTANCVALCPNCHRRCHSSMDRDVVVSALYASVDRLEGTAISNPLTD